MPQQGVVKGKVMNKVKVKKTLLKKKPQFTQKPPRMSEDEERLIRDMHFDKKMPRTDIAKLVGGDLSNVRRLLAQRRAEIPIVAR